LAIFGRKIKENHNKKIAKDKKKITQSFNINTDEESRNKNLNLKELNKNSFESCEKKIKVFEI